MHLFMYIFINMCLYTRTAHSYAGDVIFIRSEIVSESCCRQRDCTSIFPFRFARTATHRNTLQHTATHCNILQRTHLLSLAHPCFPSGTHPLQHTAMRCNILQRIAMHCNKLQHTATLCSKTHPPSESCISMLHFRYTVTATHCNTLQRTVATVIHSTALSHTATHHDARQHTAIHCDTLQYIAIHCNTPTLTVLFPIVETGVHELYTLQHTVIHCNTL